MSDLKSSYERELLLLRRGLSEFGSRNARAAGRLSMHGEQSEDMHVERLIQASALINARVRERLEDDVPDFTVPLLEVLYPEFLRSFPSCSIACFEPSAAVERVAKPAIIKRGSFLKTRVGEFGFRTVYDTVISPLIIPDAYYRLPSAVPTSVQLPQGASGVLSISFAVQSESVGLADAVAEKVRVYVDAPELATATVIDSLLHRCRSAFIELDSCGKWSALDSVPVSLAGFGEDESLIERLDGQQSQYRLLLEYFGYAAKFNFLDFHLGKLARGRTIRSRLTLHLPVCGLHPETTAAISMQELDASNFRLRCSPVINLFQCQAEPIALKDAKLPTFPMVPQKVSAEETDVWAVSNVRLTYDNDGDPISRDIKPLYSLEHYARFETASTRRPVLFWTETNQKGFMASAAGGASVLSFVTVDGEATEPARDEQIHATLLCSNGSAPGDMEWGAPDGDFAYPDRSVVGKVTLLRRPTDGMPRETRRNQYWNVIQSLAAGPFSLDRSGLPALKALLEGHIPPGSQGSSVRVDAIIGLSRETAMEWIVEKPQSRMARGLRVRLVIDEAALAGVAIVVFARVLESVFVRYAPAHSFVQLVLVSANNGSELARGQLLPGAVPLL
jgi:type VI secretion system protein ImpG